MSDQQVIDLGYTPRGLQAHLHANLKRFNVLVCHRRFGKTVFAIMEMIDQALRCDKLNPQYAYIAPTYGQAKRVAWEYLKHYTKNIPGAKPNEAELRVDIPRPAKGDKIRFMLLGAENPDSLAGIYLDGVLLDEYSLMNPVVWSTLIRPALSDRKGWGIFIGTPRGQNHFYDVYNVALENKTGQWYSAIYKASDTNVMDAQELLDARIEMSEDEYEQEFECSFTAALKGAYYSKYMQETEEQGRITNVPYQKETTVSTYWDLGISDTTAIWFIQEVGREIHIIDYIENAGVGLEYYVKRIKEKDYIYDDHYIPHDGAARELGTGRTRQETLRELGLGTRIVPRQSVADGIHSVRMLLDRCWWDRIKCSKGINAMKNYQRKWDGKNKIYLDKPMHDWCSNAADALRMFGLTYNGIRVKSVGLPREASHEYDALGV